MLLVKEPLIVLEPREEIHMFSISKMKSLCKFALEQTLNLYHWTNTNLEGYTRSLWGYPLEFGKALLKYWGQKKSLYSFLNISNIDPFWRCYKPQRITSLYPPSITTLWIQVCLCSSPSTESKLILVALPKREIKKKNHTFFFLSYSSCLTNVNAALLIAWVKPCTSRNNTPLYTQQLIIITATLLTEFFLCCIVHCLISGS